MQWNRPEIKETALCMEVTAYVNTDGDDNDLHRAPGARAAEETAAN